MRVSTRFAATLGVLVVAGLVGCAADGDADPASSLTTPLGIGGACGAGEPCDSVARGRNAFFDGKLHGQNGNGRACSDCHMASDSFQLSPASAEARWQDLQAKRANNKNADDPLFRPIDADDFRTNGDNASDFSNLRENGLVRITFNLPANVRLIDPATNAPSNETFVDVWRAVPSVNNVNVTGPDGSNPTWARGPNTQGGYQLDGRIATLQLQAQAAFTSHAQTTSPAAASLLDDIAAFENTLVTPEPTDLTDLELQGKAVFERSCASCHGGANTTTPQTHNRPGPQIPRYHDIGSACPRPVDAAPTPRWQFKQCEPRIARNARTYELTISAPIQVPNGPLLPAGTKIRRTSSDPGRTLLTGFSGGPPPVDDWNHLDNASLRGISKTAPYFHNNSAATLEDVLDHYEQFFKWVQFALQPPGVIVPILTTNGTTIDRPFTTAERPALLAYLRKL